MKRKERRKLKNLEFLSPRPLITLKRKRKLNSLKRVLRHIEFLFLFIVMAGKEFKINFLLEDGED